MGQSGSEVGFEEQFRSLFLLAYQAAFRVLNDRAAAEDVALEALARAWSRWSTVESYARPWVVRVAGGLAVDEWRKRRRRRGLRLKPVSQVAEAEQVELRADLYRELASLPRRQQEVVVARYLGDLSERDAAAQLEVSTGSVKQHTHRALRSLRRQLAAWRIQPGEEEA